MNYIEPFSMGTGIFSMVTGSVMVANGLFAQETVGTPTTILGAFIAIALGMGSLLVWIVKRLFDELDKRDKRIEALTATLNETQQAIEKNQGAIETNQKTLEAAYEVLIGIKVEYEPHTPVIKATRKVPDMRHHGERREEA